VDTLTTDKKVVEPKHDFTAKLRQPLVLPRVKDYVKWQKAVRQGIKIEAPNLTPISINLDLTTACNFRCGHCIDINVINSNSKFDHKELLLSLENIVKGGLRSVSLIGGGEPTLYPQFEEIVKFLKNRDIQVAIVSNGSRGKIIYDAVRCLKAEDKDWARLSIDAGTNGTWQKIHKPVPKITLEEVCSWVLKIRSRNPQLPIGFSFVITWEKAKDVKGYNIVPNMDEIVIATKLARKYNFSYISFKPSLTRLGDDGVEAIDPTITTGSAITRIREAINEAKKYENKNFKVIESTNLKVLEENTWRNLTHQPRTCHMAAFRQVLSPIGLFHCPGFRGIKKSYISNKDAYCDENINQTQKAVANILTNFDASKECSDCTCLLNQTNWWIEKAITGEINIDEVRSSDERHDYFF
jgi:wyosine [tRNA(Phe)-imidazoG37] synthetase (radical SAM superfamily)